MHGVPLPATAVGAPSSGIPAAQTAQLLVASNADERGTGPCRPGLEGLSRPLAEDRGPTRPKAVEAPVNAVIQTTGRPTALIVATRTGVRTWTSRSQDRPSKADS